MEWMRKRRFGLVLLALAVVFNVVAFRWASLPNYHQHVHHHVIEQPLGEPFTFAELRLTVERVLLVEDFEEEFALPDGLAVVAVKATVQQTIPSGTALCYAELEIGDSRWPDMSDFVDWLDWPGWNSDVSLSPNCYPPTEGGEPYEVRWVFLVPADMASASTDASLRLLQRFTPPDVVNVPIGVLPTE